MQPTDRTEAFSMRMPTLEQWIAEVECGWASPDGGGLNSDYIAGVCVGSATRDYAPDLPENLRGFRYRVIRRLDAFGKITRAEAESLRALADKEYLHGLSLAVQGLLVRAYVYTRYWKLRLFAGYCARARVNERYMQEVL